jgi:hypothetical protein
MPEQTAEVGTRVPTYPAFSVPATEPAPTAPPPDEEDEEKDPPPDDDLDDLEGLELYVLPPPFVPPPRSPSGWYRVLTPVEGFAGPRLGKMFLEGECIIHARERMLYTEPGGTPKPVRLVDLFAGDLHYTVEIIPEGIPPVPRSTLAAANWKP